MARKIKLNIAVLDYATSQVAIYSDVNIKPDDEHIEKFLIEHGHHISNCNYMYTQDEIEVNNF